METAERKRGLIKQKRITRNKTASRGEERKERVAGKRLIITLNTFALMYLTLFLCSVEAERLVKARG